MGYWSVGIMDGDSPCDMEGMLYDEIHQLASDEQKQRLNTVYELLDTDQLSDEESHPLLTELFNTRRSILLKNDNYINIFLNAKELFEDVCEVEEALQVLTVLYMGKGIPLPSDMRQIVRDSCVEDEWSTTDEERKAWMEHFISQLDSYDDKTPTEVETTGLFEEIVKAISNNDTGLVNK